MCYDMQDWESTPEEYIETYSFIDKEQIYTNGSKLISVFRVEQMLDHYYKERTCKNVTKHYGYGFKCSLCDFEQYDGNTLISFDYEYCPNCGVKVMI